MLIGTVIRLFSFIETAHYWLMKQHIIGTFLLNSNEQLCLRLQWKILRDNIKAIDEAVKENA